MDYREIENRFERNRDMIRERANDKLVEEIKKANRAGRASWFAMLWTAIASRLKRRGNIIQPQTTAPAPMKPQRQIKQH